MVSYSATQSWCGIAWGAIWWHELGGIVIMSGVWNVGGICEWFSDALWLVCKGTTPFGQSAPECIAIEIVEAV